MFVECFLQRGIGELHSADVCDVFALGELSVQVQPRQWLVRRILIDDRFSTLVIFLCLFFLPPFAQIFHCIEMSSLIIKSCRLFIADESAGSSAFHPAVSVLLEK